MSDFSDGPGPSATGLILAGGASRRFGAPKALARFRGRCLIEWVASALEPSCAEILVSIGAQADASAVQEAVPRARLVRDLRVDRGPIEGLGRGLLAARAPVVCVAPCDAPLLRPGFHSDLVRVLGKHEAAVPRPETMDPVRAVYRRDAALRVLRCGGDSIGSPSALVDRLDAVFLERDALLRADPTLASFIDVNRTEDLARASEEAPRLLGRVAATPAGS